MVKGKLKMIGAFTLVEILIVIAIIAILAVISLSAFRFTQARSRDSQRKSDLKEISHALELFYSDYRIYPAGNGSGEILACPFASVNPTNCVWGEGQMTDNQTTYFRILPSDPLNSQNYYYRTLANQQAYQLYAHLENKEDKNCIKDDSGVPDCEINMGIDCGGNCNFAITSANVAQTDSD